MSGGARISKADLIRLARALGVSRPDELAEQSMSRVFEVCMQTAEQLATPATGYPGHGNPNPIVRDWSRRVLDDAVELVQSCRMQFNEAPRFFGEWIIAAVRRSAGVDPSSCDHHFVDERCLRCDSERLPPLALVEDRTVEQLRADGDLPCDHAGAELAIDRATGEESCGECGESLPVLTSDFRQLGVAKREGDSFVMPLPTGAKLVITPRDGDRRENAEQWAKTMGSKGGATHA